MLKKYSELTPDQKKQVAVMYSDLTNLQMYLYNFDDNGKYLGRQYVVPKGVTADGMAFGTLRADPVEASKPAPAPELEPEIKPVKRTRRAKK